MKILAVSDTHLKPFKKTIEMIGCDYLFHCGDLTNFGKPSEVIDAINLLASQMEDLQIYKAIVVPGNHDNCLEDEAGLSHAKKQCLEIKNKSGIEIVILIDEMIELENGLKVFASPYYKSIGDGNYFGFNYTKEMALELFKKMIGTDIDILITHGPPYSILDSNIPGNNIQKENFGCSLLLEYFKNSNSRVRHHFFGHIHEQGGKFEKHGDVLHYNVATKPLIVEFS